MLIILNELLQWAIIIYILHILTDLFGFIQTLFENEVKHLKLFHGLKHKEK